MNHYLKRIFWDENNFISFWWRGAYNKKLKCKKQTNYAYTIESPLSNGPVFQIPHFSDLHVLVGSVPRPACLVASTEETAVNIFNHTLSCKVHSSNIICKVILTLFHLFSYLFIYLIKYYMLVLCLKFNCII